MNGRVLIRTRPLLCDIVQVCLNGFVAFGLRRNSYVMQKTWLKHSLHGHLQDEHRPIRRCW